MLSLTSGTYLNGLLLNAIQKNIFYLGRDHPLKLNSINGKDWRVIDCFLEIDFKIVFIDECSLECWMGSR